MSKPSVFFHNNLNEEGYIMRNKTKLVIKGYTKWTWAIFLA